MGEGKRGGNIGLLRSTSEGHFEAFFLCYQRENDTTGKLSCREQGSSVKKQSVLVHWYPLSFDLVLFCKFIYISQTREMSYNKQIYSQEPAQHPPHKHFPSIKLKSYMAKLERQTPLLQIQK